MEEEQTITPETSEEKTEETPNETVTEEKQENETEEKEIVAETQEQAQEVLQTKGFDYAELQKEFIETGKISDSTRKQLAEVGITGELVDNFIEGQMTKAEQEKNEIAECIGGRANFDNVIKWASENLSEAEIKSINGITDKSVIQIILKDLKNRMEEKDGITPNYTQGEGGKPAKDIYRSQAEMFEAISNPKYRVDEAYRADVQRKVTASREAGIDLGI